MVFGEGVGGNKLGVTNGKPEAKILLTSCAFWTQEQFCKMSQERCIFKDTFSEAKHIG